jgi:hypothetical protein
MTYGDTNSPFEKLPSPAAGQSCGFEQKEGARRERRSKNEGHRESSCLIISNSFHKIHYRQYYIRKTMARRSKRTSAVLKDGIRRSKRNVAAKESDSRRIYGEDYGIMPSD